MKSKSRIIALMLALALMFALTAACGSSNDPATEAPASEAPATEAPQTDAPPADDGNEPAEEPSDGEPQYGGHLIMWKQDFINNYDPSMPDNATWYSLYYESLWVVDWTQDENTIERFNSVATTGDNLKGQIAKDWTYDKAAGTFTVTIRDDIFLQDKSPYNGRQLNSTDIKWSYDRLIGTGSGWDSPIQTDKNWSSYLPMIESIDTDGDYTVIFNLKDGYNTETAVDDLMCASINVTGVEWDELSEDEKLDWRNAGGTGPYILDNYSLDEYMHFVRNDNYYAYDERYPENKLPYIDEITLQVVSESANRLSQFISGKIDWLSGTNPLGRSEIAQLKATLTEDEYTQYDFYANPMAIGLKYTFEPFQDIRVRQAMVMAVDLKEINKEYLGIENFETMGLFDSSAPYSSVDEWPADVMSSYTECDVEGAKALLEEAGYGDGFTFTCVIFGAFDANHFQLIASYLAKIGITMEIEVANSPPEMEGIGFDKNDPRTMFKTAGKPNANFVKEHFTTGGPFEVVYQNDEYFDNLIADMISAETMADRITLGKEADTYFASQYWIVPMGGNECFSEFVSDRVGGYFGERFVNATYRTVLPRVWLNY